VNKEDGVKRFIIVAVILSLAMFVACGGGNGGGGTKAKGEAKVVAKFFDSALKKGDLSAAFDMLCVSDQAMMGMMPGLKDFLAGKDNAETPEEMKLMRVLLKELVPVPENLISYELGEPIGEGDTMMVPVTFMFPTEDIEDFAKANMDEELIDQMDNLDQMDVSFSEKEKIIKKAIGQFKSAIKGKTFERESNTQNMTLIKEDGKWKISILASGLMNAFGGF
jgi:hypothetical protein